jgi:phosphoribosylanthranilate isomerase
MSAALPAAERGYTHVKICGLTNLDDAVCAVEVGADLLGFNFYPKSPRYITPDHAQAIVAALRSTYPANSDKNGDKNGDKNDGSKKNSGKDARYMPVTVGIFVNLPVHQVAEVLAAADFDYAQLHGDETPAALAALHGRAFKAIRPTTIDQAEEQAAQFVALPELHAPQILVDAYSPAAYGGTGHQADWSIATALANRFPRLLLAGGLTPQSVSAAIRQVHPWGVDVSSGVESLPGRKDHQKVRDFIAAVRACA